MILNFLLGNYIKYKKKEINIFIININSIRITCQVKMEDIANPEKEIDDFSLPNIENRPPESKVRSFLFNSEYPSDMALHYLYLKKIQYRGLNDTIFFEIIKNNPNVALEPESFDSEWLNNFVQSTMNCPKTDSNISLLKSIYYYFFDVVASKKYPELIGNLNLFLDLTKNPNHPITELLHCRIISILITRNFNIEFDPSEIHKISDFDTQNLHMILDGNVNGLVEYSSPSLINFAITYCIPSAISRDERFNFAVKKEVPSLVQIIPEPVFIFYHTKYFDDNIFDFCSFLLQSIYGFAQNEIDTFDEKDKDKDNNNFGIINDDINDQIQINNPQLKIKSLLDLFLNNSVVTGSFLRVILMFNQPIVNSQDANDSIINKITKILYQCPKIRLSALLRCQHLLSFFHLYSKYYNTVFNPNGGSFFANIPYNLSQSSLYQTLNPYWCPHDSIINMYECENLTLLISHAIAMINRCRLEPQDFLSSLTEISVIQISGTLTQIFEYIALCDNFSSKQAEIILFMGISSFFQMSRKNRPFLIQNRYFHHISIIATFKSLQFIFKKPQFNVVSEYGLLQRYAYKVILHFIKENIDLFKGYLDSYNNINDFYERATIMQAIHPKFHLVILYFNIFLRATTPFQFWLALKFMKSLTYTEEDVGKLVEMAFKFNDPILNKNHILFLTELILNKDGFAEMLVQSELFHDFTVSIVKSFTEDEIGNASLFLLHSLYKKNLITPEHRIRINYLQFFFDNILTLHDELFNVLCDISMMICICNKLKRFPFKIKHQKQAFIRPDSNEKNNFLVFLFINYPELSNRVQKAPTNFDVKIIKKTVFSFMNIIDKPYRYLITPVLFEGTEIQKESNNFEIKINEGDNPSFSTLIYL